MGAALGILFTEEEEQDELAMLISQRAAWYYSDSENERQQTEEMLIKFFARHFRVVRGRPFEEVVRLRRRRGRLQPNCRATR